MRRWLLAAVLAGVAHGAQAADLPDLSDLPVLRGTFTDGLSASTVNWQGFYVGGQAGVGTSNMDFTGSTQPVAARLMSGLEMESEQQVSSWPVLGKTSKSGTGFGGFAGYNAQWDDVVLSLEGSYMHGAFGGSQTNSIERFFTLASGYTDNVTYKATSTFNVTDMGSIRGRAGYAVGNFLPYMFGGVSLGLADVQQTATIFGTQVNAAAAPGFTNVPFYLSQSNGQSGRVVYGYAAGLGVDMMLFGNLFGRVEWEYLRFIGNGGTINTSINTARVGLGYKF